MYSLTIKLESTSTKKINQVISQLKQLSTALNLKLKGPIPLPNKKLRHAVRRTPCGDGSDTYETWEKRIHRRLVKILGSEKNIKQALKIVIPEEVSVKIKIEKAA